MAAINGFKTMAQRSSGPYSGLDAKATLSSAIFKMGVGSFIQNANVCNTTSPPICGHTADNTLTSHGSMRANRRRRKKVYRRGSLNCANSRACDQQRSLESLPRRQPRAEHLQSWQNLSSEAWHNLALHPLRYL